MIQSRVDIEPGSPPVRHTHPGEEIIYVLAGSLEYQIDGQPTKVYHAGQALTVPAGVTPGPYRRESATARAAVTMTSVTAWGWEIMITCEPSTSVMWAPAR
jgi:quercetin dioxygenase-like cupin family protein